MTIIYTLFVGAIHGVSAKHCGPNFGNGFYRVNLGHS
jgi:hypothetical protein